ncbi:hypothetical protein DV735_g3641, partial [Chaetothyriales sp. CBS 134920]
MADSDSSSLSSAPSTDDEAMEELMSRPTGINRYFKPLSKDDADAQPTPPPPPRRSPSPPHEYVLADNEAIAFLVMFRSRFHEAFPKSLSHYGPQDIENGVSGELPDEQVERLLCALLGLVLNRKKEVERGHYGRALEEAIASNHNQWPTAWNGANPLHGGKSFSTMSPEERLVLLKTLVLWALNSSDVVQALIKDSYKQTRRDDDKNQPRSVQPWFSDSYRRRYWLIEGLEDSRFRIYRENDGRTTKSNTWFSVAGTVDEVNALADKFAAEATANSKINSDKLRSAIPRFEAGEVKRQRKEYRVARKAAFARPEPGFSLYEGRTRGKRMKYTFSEGEEDETDFSTRRNPTPQNSLPTVTASGRQVKSRLGRLYGDSPPSDQQQAEQELATTDAAATAEAVPKLTAAGRPMRGAARPKREGFEHGGDSDSEEHHSDGQEWSGNEDEYRKAKTPSRDESYPSITVASGTGPAATTRETAPNGAAGQAPTTEHRDLALAPAPPLVEHVLPNGLGAGAGANVGGVGDSNGMDLERYARPQMQVDVS